MTEARPPDFNRKARRNQQTSDPEGRSFAYYRAHRPRQTVRLLTLSEAAELLGVDYKVIYRLAELELIDPMQRDGKGRIYYSERQIRRAVTANYHLAA